MFNEDNHNKNNTSETVYISLGNYCLTSMLLKDNNLKYESYPFDWMITCIDNITHVFNDNFVQFTNKENYIKTIKNSNITTKNNFYFSKTNELFGSQICDHQHHNLILDDDYQYLLRCIDRLKNVFNNYKNVVLVMIQPLYLTNKNVDIEKIKLLYSSLKKYFLNKKFKLLVFNICKKDNDKYIETKINEETILYELETSMCIGKSGMFYFDKKGINKFLEIIKSII